MRSGPGPSQGVRVIYGQMQLGAGGSPSPWKPGVSSLLQSRPRCLSQLQLPLRLG